MLQSTNVRYTLWITYFGPVSQWTNPLQNYPSRIHACVISTEVSS